MTPTNDPLILMVDDSEEDVELLSFQLKSAGVRYTLNVCDNTDAAAAYITACDAGKPAPHLIVLDLHLPPQNGEAVFREIRRTPALMTVPVLIMTTSATPTELDGFRSQPNTYVSTKPYSLKDYEPILRTISALLKGSTANA